MKIVSEHVNFSNPIYFCWSVKNAIEFFFLLDSNYKKLQFIVIKKINVKSNKFASLYSKMERIDFRLPLHKTNQIKSCWNEWTQKRERTKYTRAHISFASKGDSNKMQRKGTQNVKENFPNWIYYSFILHEYGCLASDTSHADGAREGRQSLDVGSHGAASTNNIVLLDRRQSQKSRQIYITNLYIITNQESLLC